MSNPVLSPQAWLGESVQTFFKTCNWDNQSERVQEVQRASLTQEPIELTLALSVGQFFAAVNWDGVVLVSRSTEEVADNLTAIEDLEAVFAKPVDDGFTLSNFSDLF